MAQREVVLCTPMRTALGTFNGTLKDMPAVDLGAVVIRAAMERAGIDPARVDGVVMGNVIQAGNKMNPARQAAVAGGVPVSAPAMTVNRVCGSGAQAIASAAQEIRLGEADVDPPPSEWSGTYVRLDRRRRARWRGSGTARRRSLASCARLRC
jgi:acetyl-CoA C-acetyltransferase